MQNVWDQKKATLKILAENFITCGQLSHKNIVNNLKQFKESYMVAFLVFL